MEDRSGKSCNCRGRVLQEDYRMEGVVERELRLVNALKKLFPQSTRKECLWMARNHAPGKVHTGVCNMCGGVYCLNGFKQGYRSMI